MAALTMASSTFRPFPLHASPIRAACVPVQQSYLKLTSQSFLSVGSGLCISGPLSNFAHKPCSMAPPAKRLQSFTVFAAKAKPKKYKLKTHKASAKRFRVTGSGKIVRRRAGKQHLLYKKNAKRRRRLSKLHPVDRRDYDNVMKCLPYLKVNRNAK